MGLGVGVGVGVGAGAGAGVGVGVRARARVCCAVRTAPPTRRQSDVRTKLPIIDLSRKKAERRVFVCRAFVDGSTRLVLTKVIRLSSWCWRYVHMCRWSR